MRPSSELKQDFDVMAGLGDIVDVLKTATMVQFRTFQAREKPDVVFVREAEDILLDILARMEGDHVRHPFFYDRSALPSLILVVSSDEGFLGEINTQIVNAALDQRSSSYDEMIVLGSHGARYLEDMKIKHTIFPALTDKVSPAEVQKITDVLLDRYRKAVGRLIVVYPEFLSLTSQKVSVWRGLPSLERAAKPQLRAGAEGLLIEPTPTRVLEGLIELWFASKMFQLFWSSKLAEYAARIMHLEGSSQELQLRRKKLSLEYFRQVHTLRDKVIREITSSRQIADN